MKFALRFEISPDIYRIVFDHALGAIALCALLYSDDQRPGFTISTHEVKIEHPRSASPSTASADVPPSKDRGGPGPTNQEPTITLPPAVVVIISPMPEPAKSGRASGKGQPTQPGKHRSLSGSPALKKPETQVIIPGSCGSMENPCPNIGSSPYEPPPSSKDSITTFQHSEPEKPLTSPLLDGKGIELKLNGNRLELRWSSP